MCLWLGNNNPVMKWEEVLTMTLHKVTMLLVILGAVNVGMISWFSVDLFSVVFGGLSSIITLLVGLSGVYMFLTTYTTLIKKTA